VIACEEIFGPVISIIPFKDIDEVIERGQSQHVRLAARSGPGYHQGHRWPPNSAPARSWINCYDVFDPPRRLADFKMSGIAANWANMPSGTTRRSRRSLCDVSGLPHSGRAQKLGQLFVV